MDERNGILEAINELKKDRDTLFDRLHEINNTGCPYGRQSRDNQSRDREEVAHMNDQLERIRRQQNIWIGAVSILIPLMTVLLSVLVRKYL